MYCLEKRIEEFPLFDFGRINGELMANHGKPFPIKYILLFNAFKPNDTNDEIVYLVSL